MESAEMKDPKDDKITNEDNAVTNKDGDNDLEKGKQPIDQKKPDKERVPTITPDNENGNPGPAEEKEESSSNRKVRLSGENFVI
ncbi:MAG: hypothetical protein JWR54_3933 [Mucilaginibacter sp.]|nr:hypothetical protein [Mucilaginibacter sp.]